MRYNLFGEEPLPHAWPGRHAGLTAQEPTSPPAPSLDTLAGPAALDLVVDENPGDTLRHHLAQVFAAGATGWGHQAAQHITLLDPARLWATDVLHTLARASGQNVHRLNLRERSTHRTLAVIERTLVPRRTDHDLRVLHADLHISSLAYGLDQQEITAALAGSSDLTAVILGAMAPKALATLLQSLVQASHDAHWRCPRLLLVLPPAAASQAQLMLAQPWPERLLVSVMAEPLNSPVAVWNCLLGQWRASLRPLALAHDKHPSQEANAPGINPVLSALLISLARTEGLVACGAVDLARGELLAGPTYGAMGHPGQQSESTPLAAMAQALCRARHAHGLVSKEGDEPEEILITTGGQQAVLRQWPGQPGLGLVALLEGPMANLGLLRFKLKTAEGLLT
jgi:hypothetical protein